MKSTSRQKSGSQKSKRTYNSLTLLLMLPLITSCATRPVPVATIEPAIDQIFCDEFRVMSFALPGDDDVETEQNQFDTEETALQVYRHNRKLERLCTPQPPTRRSRFLRQ